MRPLSLIELLPTLSRSEILSSRCRAASRLGALCLLAAVAAMLPTQADAGSWTSPQTGYKFTWDHVTEGNDASFTIELVDAKGRSLPENTSVYTENGTTSGYVQATAGTDYTAYNQTHSFNLNTSITVTISTTEDETIEGDEGFYLYVQPGGSGNDKSRVFTRINNDDVGTITISDKSVDEGGNVTFTAKHTGKAAAYGFKAKPKYTNGTAESGDYTANTTQLSFSGTLNEEKTFTVSTTQDAVFEDNETVTVGFDISGQAKVKYGTVGVSGGSATLTINNDDAAAVTVNDASAFEGDDMTFTITLNNDVEDGLTVTPGSYTNGTAASGDYTQNTTGISFSGTKDETKTFTVSTTEDAVFEGNETFTVGLGVSNAPSGVTSSDTGTGTIKNDDSAAVTVNDASAFEGDDMTFTITLNNDVEGGLTVTPGSYTNGTAASGDYTQNTTDISFSGTKDETKTFTVSTTEDAVFEGNETFTVGLGVSNAPSGVTSSDTGTGTINNDDSAAVTINDASASEGESMTFTVTLSEAVQDGLTVTPSFTDVSAVEGTDYDEDTTALTFTGTKGETQTFTVDTTEDAVFEGNETFTVGLSVSNAPDGVTSTDTGTGTVNNDDSAAVTINDANADEGESMTFTVTLSEAVQGGLTVTPGFTDGTAVEGTDYDENTAGLSFSGTKGETQTFTVSTTEDAVFEGNETFTVGLSVSNAPDGVTSTDTGTGTVNNDDSATVTVNDASASEGESMTFTVTLSEAVQGGLTVTPGFTDGTAVEGTDYDENTAGLSFTGTKGETKTFTVSTAEDAVLEGNETFTVGLTVSDAPDGVTSTDTGTGTVNNDDSATVTIDDANADEGESMTFTVTLSEAVQGGLTVTPSFTDVSAVEGTDYDENTAGLSFTGTKDETQTFTVSTTEDAVLEGNETFTVSLSVSSAPSGVTSTDTGTGTVNNDDSATVTIDDASAFEGDDMTFTVTLSEAVQGGLTVTPTFTDGTAVEGTDYDENTSGLSFSGTKGETKTFTVSTTEEANVEGNETFTVGLSVSGAPAGVTSTDTGTGTINNDDSSSVTINDASANEGESMTFTVTLSEAVQGGLTVTPSFTDVTAVEGTDYDENTTGLSFTGTKGETKTFTVSTTEEANVEGNETFTVGLSVSNAPSGITATDTGTGTINNDDSSSITINDASASEGESMTFTVTLSEAVQGGLTVTPGFTDVTAVEGTDYDENTAGLSFSGTKGETKTFTVSTTEEAVLEHAETFTVSLSVSGAPSGVTSTDTGTGTINNDDSATVTVNDANADEGESMTFTVTLSEAVQDGLTVTPSFTDGTAVGGTDYVLPGKAIMLVFTGTKGETKTFTVSTTEDAVVEYGETFTVGLSVSGAPSGVTSSDTGTGTINNDDSAEVSVNDASVAESGSMTFTVTLSEAVQGGVTVTPSYTDGTTTSSDYTANTTALNFSGTKSETQSFTVSTTADAVVEGNETFTVSLSVSNAPPGVTVAGGGSNALGKKVALASSGGGTGTILNDDSAKVTIDDASAEEGDAITFTLTLDAAVQGGLTVTPSYTDGLVEVPGTDYTANTAGVSFAGTVGETQTFTVSTIEDTYVESDETFTVGLSVSGAPSGVTSSDTGTGTIDDDEVKPYVRADFPSVQEGDSGTTILTFGARLTFEHGQTVGSHETITAGYEVYTASGYTATPGTDYTATNGTLTFAPGEISKTVAVSVIGDTKVEGDEVMAYAWTSTTNSVVALSTYTGTITDDDYAALTIGDARADEGGDLTFTVSLNRVVQGGLKVTPSFTDGTATEGSDYDANTTVLSFRGTAGETETLTVSTLADEDVEGDETFTVGLSVSRGPSEMVTTDTGTGTILNDDSATVTIDDASADEGDSMTFTVTLDKAVVGGLTVTPSFTDGTATAGRDYTANTTALSFTGTAGETQTFTVSTTQDAVLEGDETFTVGLSVSNSNATASGTGTGTITDDDGAAVTIGDASTTEGGALTFTVALDQAVAGGLTVTPSFTDGTAVQGSDYTANTTALAFTGTANESHSFTVSTTDDGVVESDETFTVGLSVSNAPSGVTASASATGTIQNDDVRPTVAVSGPDTTQQAPFNVSIDFSTSVTGFEQSDLGVSNGSVTSFSGSGADYTATITPVAANSTVVVTVAADAAHDSAGNGNEGSPQFSVQIIAVPTPPSPPDEDPSSPVDNPAPPGDDPPVDATVSISNASAAEGDSLTFTVTLDQAVAGGLTVTPTFADGTATQGSDYTANTTALAFTGTAGESHSFTVDATQDAVLEGNETFTIGLSASHADVTATDTGTGTITDDDSAAVSVSDASATEGSSLTFTVTLDKAVAGGLTVTPSFTDGTATQGSDYTANTTGLHFTGTAGESQSFSVSTTDDAVLEAAETFMVGLSASHASVTATDTGTGTINDDDRATVSVSDASATEGSSLTFTVTLDKAVAGGLTVTPSFTDGTAVQGSDYAANTTGLSFTGTAGESQTFSVSTTQDALLESAETFTVGLSVSGTSISVTAPDTGTGTIDDDDRATVSVSDASATEGSSMTFTVTLDKAVAGGLTVTPSFIDGTATQGSDYTANTTGLSFTGTAGESHSFSVSTTQDAVLEAAETFTVSLSASHASVTAPATGTGTIDDDDRATVSVSDASATEGSSMTFTVTLDQAVAGGLTVTPSFTDGTAVQGSDYTANTSALSFTGTAGESHSFSVSTTDDAVLEVAETFTVGLSASHTSVTASDIGTGTIDDGDQAAVTIGDASATEGSSLTFTVSLDQAVAGGLTVTPSFTDGTATQGSDYTANTSALSFTGTAGESQTFTVATTDDAVLEAAETFTVGLSASHTSVTASDTGTGTIDDGDQAAVSVSDASATEGSSLTFTVTLDKAVAGGLTVTPSFTDGTATQGSDYTANTTGLSFAGTAGESQTFSVSTTDDAVLEAAETFTVGLRASHVGVTASDTGTGTIDDGDQAAVSVSDASATEGGSMTFTVSLDQAVAGGLTVTPSFTDGTATQGSDYTANTSALSFAGTAGESQTFSVSTTDDAVLEAAETFTVGLSASHVGVTASDTGTGTIDDGDQAAVSVSDASATEGSSLTFTVTLDKAVAGGLTVTPSFTDGTATQGSDYTANTSALSFTGTAGESQTFTVATTDDAVLESVETFTVGLSASHVGVTATDTGTGTIDDGDQAAVSISDASATEGGSMTFTVTLDKAVAGGLTVTPSFTDGTAVQGSDYTANATGLSFAGTAGESQTFSVSTTDDAVLEAAETFTVGLSVSHTSVTATDTGTGTIDDDDRAAVSVSDASATEGGSMTFTVTLDQAVAGGLTVTPSFADGTAVQGSDYTANTTGLSFAGTAGESQTFSVSTTDDAVLEAVETFTVGLSASHASVTATDTGTGTIIDDDGAAVSISDASATEGSSMTFTVTLDQAVAGGLTVTPTFTDGTAMQGSDYTANTAPLSFIGTAGESQTFTVATTADGAVESHETFTVGLRASHASATATDTGIGTILNDDVRPTVAVSGPTTVQNGAFDVSILFSTSVTGFEQSDLSVGNGSASGLSGSGASYTATITPTASGSVTVAVAEDVAHDAAGNGNQAAVPFSVQADVDAPTVSLSGPQTVQGIKPFDVSIAFSESVAGFEQSDLSVGNGSASGLSGSGGSYTATVTPAALGTATVSVAAEVAHDAAGNGNQAAVPLSVQIEALTITSSPDTQFRVPVANETPTVSDDRDEEANQPMTIVVTDENEVPDAPDAPEVTGESTTSLLVVWTAPSTAEGAPISDYDVRYRLAVSGAVFTDVGYDGTGLTATLAGLQPGTTYEVQVRAHNDEGTSPWSAPGTGTTHANTAPTFAGDSDRSVVENTPAGQPIGAPVQATDVDGDGLTYALSGEDAAAFALDADSGQVRTKAALDYESRTTYAVVVEVSDGQGGEANQPVTIIVTDENEPPAAPDAPTVTGVSTTSLVVDWTALSTSGGLSVSDYDVQSRVANSGIGPTTLAGLQLSTTSPVGGPSVSDYDVQSRVANSGAGLTDVDYEGTGPTTLAGLQLSTTSPAGRPPISDYDVQYRVADSGAAFTDASYDGTSTTATLTGLQPGTTYEVQARAHNDEGTSPWSPPGTGRTHENTAPTFVDSSAGSQDVGRSVAENTPAGQPIGTPVQATDADGDGLTYALAGEDAAAFALDADSGQVRTKAALDYETRTTYAVVVEVSDGQGGTARLPVTIAVTDENEPPAAPAAPEVTGVSSTSLLVAWTAPSPVGRPSVSDYDVQYRVADSGAAFTDAGYDGTGPTTTLAGLQPGTAYEVQVRAHNDEGTSPWSVPGTGRTHENTAPTFVDGSQDVGRSVVENTPAGQPIGAPVEATDVDGDGLTYALAGEDAAAFALDADSGQVRTLAALDYESRTTYAVVVEVSDGQGGTARLPVTIAVTDENEPPDAPDAPTVTGASSTSLLVAWTAPSTAGRPAVRDHDVQYRVADSGTGPTTLAGLQLSTTSTVGGLSVSDYDVQPRVADSGAGLTDVDYEGTGPTTLAGLQLSTTSTAGGLSVSDYDVQYRVADSGSAFTDAGYDGTGTTTTLTGLQPGTAYEVQVRAHNDEGTSPWSVPGTGRTHENTAPTFVDSSQDVGRSVAENTPAGQPIGAPVQATDVDGDALTYTLSGEDAAAFALDADSGQVRTLAALDYETRTTYAVVVEVSDGQGGTARLPVTITVTDENEPPAAPDAPTVTGASSTSLAVAWTAPSMAGGPSVSDYDVQYRVADSGAAFTDAGYDGMGPTMTLAGLQPDTAYEVQVRAHNDEGTSPWSVPGTGRTHENAVPTFAAGSDRGVAENTPAGQPIGAPVSATDADGDALTYALVGEDAAAFALDADSGQVRTLAALDYETRTTYAVIVEVSDGQGGTARLPVTIAVTDENEPPAAPDVPEVTGVSSTSLAVAWSAPANLGPPISDYDVRYRLADSGGSFTDAGYDGTGTAATLAGLQPGTAYEVQVRAHNDEGTSPWSPLGTGRTHENTAPTFTERADPSTGTAPDDGVELLELNISVSEMLAVGQPLGASVQATDTDGDVLVYSLMGRDAGAFTIDPNTGQLRPLVALNHEGQTTFLVVVEVSDGQGGTARLSVTITVTDENEPPAAPDAPEVTGVSSTSLAVAWSAPANLGPPISDYDMRYRLADSGAVFTDPGYDGTSTAATLAGLRPDKAYEVQVRAHNDEGTSPWSPLGTGRTHENTAPAFTELADPSAEATDGAVVELLELNISVSETMAVGQPIDTPILGTDADGDVLVYSLMGRDAGAFIIDANTGQLQPVVGFNHEGQTTFSVVIQVSDGQGGTARLPVTIVVTDEAEPPDVPDAPTVTGVSPTGLAVAWTAPANLGPPISDYDVQYRVADSGGAFTDAGYDGTGTAATLDGLSPDTAYEVYVRAHNDEGTSGWSAPGADRTDKRPLVAPVLADQTATAGTPFRYQFAAVDPPGAYAATQADGTGLPTWLHFDAATRTFGGTPPVAGTLTIEVTVSDGPDRSASATFALWVVQAAPVAVDDEASVAEGGSVTIDVLANDTDFDGDRLSVHIVEETSHGVVEVQADGTVTYTHDGSETVGDQFRYRVHDGTVDSEVATVTIAVGPVNDAPTADAGADQVVAEEAAVQLSGSGTDPEGEVLTYRWTQVSGATMTLSDATSATPTFTAPTQLVSDATLVFELVVTDASGAASAADAVSITVEAGANDAPVFDSASYAFELAENEAGQPTPLAVGHVVASDPEGEAVTYALDAGDGSRFALDATSGALTYIGAGEDAEATEGYALTAQAADPHGASTSVEVWIAIGNVDEPGKVTLSTSEPQIGQVVSAQLQDPDGAVTDAAWQWQRSADGSAWNAIAGATADRYTPVLDDDGRRLRATVTYTDPARTSPLALASEATEPVQVATEDANRTRQLALAAVGRSVAEDVIEALNARMVAARHPESYLTINGQRTVIGRVESKGSRAAAHPEATAEQRRHPLDNSEFQLAIDETNELTLWGRGALEHFSGQPDQATALTLKGQLGYGYLGVDYRRAGAATGVGMMLLRNQGTLDYRSTIVNKDQAALTLTNVLPYVHWRPKAGVDVWSLVGYGRGKVELFEDDPVRLRMGAVGLRYALRSFGGVALAAKTDAFAVQLTPDAGAGSVARRLRLALESRLNWRVAAQASLQPMFELGVRWDGGDAAAGPGAELAGGLTYRHDRYGLQVEARGRRLLAHREDHVGLWGGSLMLRRQSQDRRGLQVALGPSWGEATSQVESLWRGGTLMGSARPGESWTPSELTLTGGYGLRLSAASRLTPFVEAGTGPMQRLRVGTRWEWTGAGSRRVELFGEQRSTPGTAPSRGIRIRGTLDL